MIDEKCQLCYSCPMKTQLLHLSFAVFFSLYTSSAFAEHLEPTRCYNSELKKMMKGYPSPDKKHTCLATIARLPVERISFKGPILTVQNFTHDNKLWFATIDTSQIYFGALELLKFAPVVGYHAQLRIQFNSPHAIKLYSSAEAIATRASAAVEMDSLLLSIEGMPKLGESYAFTSAIKHDLTIVYRMMSMADKKDYVIREKYETEQYLLEHDQIFYVELLWNFLKKSAQTGLSVPYDLVTRNCGNEMMRIFQMTTASFPELPQISAAQVIEATLPKLIPSELKLKNKLSNLEVDETITLYNKAAYDLSEQDYQRRLNQMLKEGVFVE